MSISSTSASLPVWRVAVIGIVGLLAVGIGVAAGAFLLNTRAAALGAGAAYVPASAPLYFEVRIEPSSDEDVALRELLGRFPPIEGIDLAQPLYSQLVESLDEMLLEEGAELSWSEDIEPWFDGTVAAAVLEIPTEALDAQTDPMEAAMEPPMVVLIGLTDRAAAEAAIADLFAQSPDGPTEFTEQVHDGVTIHSDVEEQGAYAVTDDQLIVAPGPDDIIAALDAHGSGEAALAGAESFAEMAAALPDDWLAFSFYDFTDLMAAALSQAGAESPAMADALAPLLENQPLRGAVAVTAAGDRIAVDATTDAPTGPFAATNADRGLADEVPGDVLYYAEGGSIGTSLGALIGPIKDAAAETPEGAEGVAMIEAALGADLEEVVAWIGDGALAVGWDGSEPYGGLVLVPTDIDAAERRLDQLATFAGLGSLDPSSGISVAEREVGSVTVTAISFEAPAEMIDPTLPVPATVTVEYAVTSDRVIVGVGETFVDRVLGLDAGDSLASNDRFAGAVDDLGGPNNAGVAWVDLTGVREAVESALPMTGADADKYTTEIQPWLLPLDRLVAVTRLEGDQLVQRSALLVE